MLVRWTRPLRKLSGAYRRADCLGIGNLQTHGHQHSQSVFQVGVYPPLSPRPLSHIGQFYEPIFNAKHRNTGRQQNMGIGRRSRALHRTAYQTASDDGTKEVDCPSSASVLRHHAVSTNMVSSDSLAGCRLQYSSRTALHPITCHRDLITGLTLGQVLVLHFPYALHP